MPSLFWEIVIVLCLLCLNGLFAMAEMATVSARKARLQEMAEDGDAGAAGVLKLQEQPDRFLSTVQIGITVIGIVASAFGGPRFAVRLEGFIEQVPVLVPYAEELSFGLVVAVLTYFSLVLGELVPKQIAYARPEHIASWFSRPLIALSRVASPLVSVLSASSNLILRILPADTKEDPKVTEGEVKMLLEESRDAGVLGKEQHDILSRVMDFGDRRASSMMTARNDVHWIDATAPAAESLRQIVGNHHSDYPVCEKSIDNVIGIVSVKAVAERLVAGEAVDFRQLAAAPLIVPESLDGIRILEEMRRVGAHMAIVADEYGGTSGIITLHDVLEAMVGHIDSAAAPGEEAAVIRRADGSFLFNGWVAADEAARVLEIDALPGVEEERFDSLGGFLLSRLGRIPKETDYVDWSGYRFEVMDMDGARIDKILVSRRVDDPTAGAAAGSPT